MAKSLNWETTYAAVWRRQKRRLRAVTEIDWMRFDDLLGIEPQKTAFCQNLERFLDGEDANHTLLWGARGTGKSSLIKAALQRYHTEGLRVLELEKEDIADLPMIADRLRSEPWRFIVFCDDLTFEPGDARFRHLKVLMEGSIEKPPENILLMTTSNRRHLVGERMQDNQNAEVGANGELHYGDQVEESLSLADRFGLRLSFYAPNQDGYLAMVDQLFDGESIDDVAALHQAAINFATARGGRSGRVAKQFARDYRAGLRG